MELAQPKSFDPYHKWLGIRDCGSPPNYYRLLGLELWETDAEIIHDAAFRQLNHVRQFRVGPRREECLRMIEELEQARDTLLDGELRKAYDRRLKVLLDNTVPDSTRYRSNASTSSDNINPHAAPAAAPAADVTCSRCSTKNLSVRHFCASCGAALWEPCWECGALCGPGELHCGGCGVNLAAAFQKKLDDLQTRLEQAQQLRQSHEHDRAIDLLQDWPAASHPKLTALRQQAERMIGQLQSDVAQAEQRAKTALADAQRFHDDGNFERAAELLSRLPTRLLTDPMRQLLEQTRDCQAESLVLECEIREHLDRKQADRLLLKVDRLLELKPHNAEAQGLQSRLRAWEARRMEARREQLSKLAISEAQRHQYANAVGLLEQIPADARTPALANLLHDLSQRAAEVQWLKSDLRNAVVFDEHLLPIAERLLKFQPNDPLVKKMVVDLKARSQQNPSASSTIKAVATNSSQQSGNGAAVEFVERFRRIDARQIELPHFTIGPNRFCVAAGLALQALQLGPLQTNLAPAEKGGVFGLLKSRKRTGNCSWGIDLGSSALKAIQLEYSAGSGHVVTVKSEFIELDKPHDPTGSARQGALAAFLEKNDLRNCSIAVSLPGLKVVTRIFTLPLIARQKIADIMRYEVKQQIPLPAERLVWDYHLLDGEMNQPVVRADAEHSIALFASQLDDVSAQLQPFVDRRIQVDIVQSESAALYNFLAYEYLLPTSDRSEPSNCQQVMGLLDIGAEASNIVISNGQTFWLRTIPLGGNSFTRALATDMKLDGRQAEQLKRKPTAAPRLHRVYSALEPTMQKIADEVQASVDQFLRQDNHRSVKRLLVAGGGSKLHGMLRFLHPTASSR